MILFFCLESTLNTPELPPDVDSLVDHLSEELKHAAEKLFQVDPPGTAERDASTDEEGLSEQQVSGENQTPAQDHQQVSGKNQTSAQDQQQVSGENQTPAQDQQQVSGENQTSAQDQQQVSEENQISAQDHQNDESTNLLDEISNDIEKENTKRMGQLSVELKEAAEKLFAVDPLGSSERELSSSDQSSSCSDSSSEADDQISEKSEEDVEQSDSDSVHSLSRQTPVDFDKLATASVDTEVQREGGTEVSHSPQWNETGHCDLQNSIQNKCEKEQDSSQNEDISDDESCEMRKKEKSIEYGRFCGNDGNECTLIITDVRSESVDFHQNEKETTPKSGYLENEGAHKYPNSPPNDQTFSNSLINLEENETSLIVENVFSLSEERKEDRNEDSLKSMDDDDDNEDDDDDTFENIITSRSLRDRKAMAKSNVTEANQPQEPKRRKRMKRSLKTNTRQAVRKTTIESKSRDNFNTSEIDRKAVETIQIEEGVMRTRASEDESAKETSEKEKMSAFTLQEDGQYKCHYCSCILSTKGRFQLHIKRLHNKKYTCRHCGKKFLKCQDLAIHVKTKHGDELKYKICKKGEVILMRKEQQKPKNHHKKSTFIVAKDNGQVSYACGYCDDVFDKQQSLACHIRNKHVLPNNSGKIVYQKSGKFKRKKEKRTLATLTPSAVESTIGSEIPKKKVRRNTTDSLECDDTQNDLSEVLEKKRRRDTKASRAAERGLEKIAKLQEDFNIHISHQIFRCCYCPKWFFKKADLSSHMQKHITNLGKTNNILEEPNKIENVADDDIEKDERKSRLRSKEFFCKYCTSKYKSLYTLKTHIVRHIGELYKDEMTDNRLECAFCGQYFYNVNCSNIGTLMRHLFQHYAPETEDIDVYNLLECRYCGVPFLSVEKLRSHEYEHEKFLQAKRCNTKTNDQPKKLESIDKERVEIGPESSPPAANNPSLLQTDALVPFTCGMCCSRFPTSQYLLHHMTLHMKGKYVFRVEVDKTKSTQESQPNQKSPGTPTFTPPCQSTGSLAPKKKITKQTVHRQSENKPQHISPIIQDRIMSMLRTNTSTDEQNSERKEVPIRDPGIDGNKLRLKTASDSSNLPSKKDDNTSDVYTSISDAPNMHNYARAPQRKRNYVSIITRHPYQTLSSETAGSTNDNLPTNNQNLEINKNKRKQTFRASEIKTDIPLRPIISYKEVIRNHRNDLFHRNVSEKTEEEGRGAFGQRAEDLSYRSSTETGEEEISDATDNDTEPVKLQASRQTSKYVEVRNSSDSSSSSDSASDYERDWRSRYNKKRKRTGRKRKKRSRKRFTVTKLSNAQNGWNRKTNISESKKCSICSYTFTEEEKYLLHMKSHETLKESVKCNECHQEFVTEQHLETHKSQHRSNEYQCSYCEQNFATPSAIMGHIEEVHKSQ